MDVILPSLLLTSLSHHPASNISHTSKKCKTGTLNAQSRPEFLSRRFGKLHILLKDDLQLYAAHLLWAQGVKRDQARKEEVPA